MSETLYQFSVPGAAHWSLRIRRGTLLRLTDIEGGANVGMMFYNPEDLLEKYNAPDTLKCQHTFKLTRGNCLYSDMGRIFCSITEDSFGWHETVCGNANKEKVVEKWGEKDYQAARNAWHQNGYDSFLVELAKYGLNGKDMASNLNLFSKVVADDAGKLSLDASAAKKGASITLRFEMDTLVILHTCPHPLSTAESYPYKPVLCELMKADPVSADDYCLNFRPENKRGFENNRLYYFLESKGSEPFDVPASTIAPSLSESNDSGPIETFDSVPSPLRIDDAIFSEVVPAGDYFLKEVKAGQTLRILDLEGNQAADTLFYNAHDVSERYSAMDTIREQGNVYLTAGTKLLSNLGNEMLEITADTCGRHDTLGGACATESNTVRYALEKRCMHACRDTYLLAIAEHEALGLSKRDITHNINFFMNVPVTTEGGLSFADGISAPGKYVEMKAAMDVIVLISNCPQLNNPCNGYNPTPVEVLIWE